MEIDREVSEVEQRIARRRVEIAQTARATGRRAVQSLASPVALGTAVAVGFVAGGLMKRKRRPARFVERRRVDRSSTKKRGLASILAAGAMALVKARYGSPVGLAHELLARMRKQAPPHHPHQQG